MRRWIMTGAFAMFAAAAQAQDSGFSFNLSAPATPESAAPAPIAAQPVLAPLVATPQAAAPTPAAGALAPLVGEGALLMAVPVGDPVFRVGAPAPIRRGPTLSPRLEEIRPMRLPENYRKREVAGVGCFPANAC